MADQSKFELCIFENNYANATEHSGKSIEFLSCEKQLIFNNCTFKDNKASSATSNLYFTRALGVTLINCIFYNTDKTSSQNESILRGSFMQINAES